MTTGNTELIQLLQHLRQQAYAANRVHESQAFKDAADALQALAADRKASELAVMTAERDALQARLTALDTALADLYQADKEALDTALADLYQADKEALNRMTAERDALQAKLTALENQEPVGHFWKNIHTGEIKFGYLGESVADSRVMEELYPAAGALKATPETTAEQFIQAAIDTAPKPLRRLGEYLSRVLDEDQWTTAEGMLLGIASAAVPVANIDAVMGQVQVFASAWSLVGSRFDFGQAVDDAKLAEAELRAMLSTKQPEPASAKPLPLATIVVTSMGYRITASTNEIVRFVRAIEQLHNIKGQL